MKNFWNAEPTAIIAFVSAVTALAVGFGLNIDAKQGALIQTAVIALLAIINRAKVTSPATLQSMTPETLAKAQDAAEPVKDVVRKLP